MLVVLLFAQGSVLAQPAPPGSPSISATATPSPTPTPNPQQIAQTRTVFGALGFLFGFFLTYSITVGTKAQDVFKSFLGIAGLGSGILETWVFPEGVQLDGLFAYGAGALWGFGVYVLIAAVLSAIYAYTYDPHGGANVPPPSGGASTRHHPKRVWPFSLRQWPGPCSARNFVLHVPIRRNSILPGRSQAKWPELASPFLVYKSQRLLLENKPSWIEYANLILTSLASVVMILASATATFLIDDALKRQAAGIEGHG
jgi:hypothetical protein